jgi:hypothetical protein
MKSVPGNRLAEPGLSRNSRGNETALKQRPNVFNKLEERESDNEANTTGIPGGPEPAPVLPALAGGRGCERIVRFLRKALVVGSNTECLHGNF